MEEQNNISINQPKKSRLWIWISLIVAIVIIVTFILLVFPLGETNKNYSQRAFEQHNASICLEMNPDKGEYYPTCFSDIAYRTSDISFCTELKEGWDYQCASTFLTIRYCKFGEILCNDFKNQKDRNNCYRITAIAKNDVSLCDQMILDKNEDTSGSATYDNGITISWKDSIEECEYAVKEQNSKQTICASV
jgi:hypothetical protein